MGVSSHRMYISPYFVFLRVYTAPVRSAPRGGDTARSGDGFCLGCAVKCSVDCSARYGVKSESDNGLCAHICPAMSRPFLVVRFSIAVLRAAFVYVPIARPGGTCIIDF